MFFSAPESSSCLRMVCLHMEPNSCLRMVCLRMVTWPPPHTHPDPTPHPSPSLCSNLRVCKLSREEAAAFYEVHRGKPFYDMLVSFMSSGRICAMELTGPDAIAAWRALLGPTDSDQARQVRVWMARVGCPPGEWDVGCMKGAEEGGRHVGPRFVGES